MIARAKRVYWSLGPEASEWWFAFVRVVPGKIGMSLRASVYRRRMKSCGKSPVIQQYVVISHPDKISIGDGFMVNRFAQIQGGGGVTIGNHVMIGPGVFIWSINHGFSDSVRPMSRQGYTAEPVYIGDNVWIGAGAIVLPGTDIGNNVIVGAGSVVRGKIPSGVLVAGVPAVVKRKILSEDNSVDGA